MTGWEAILRAEAYGRIDALIAVLGMAPRPADEDISWAAIASCSVEVLCGRLGVDPAEAVTALADLCAARGDGRAAARDRFVAALNDARAKLAALGTAVVPGHVKLDEVAAAAQADVDRLAVQRGIPIVTEIVLRPGSSLARAVGGGVIDAMGLVTTHMAERGCVHGGSIRIEIRRDGEDVAVTLGDRGNAASRDARLGPDDGLRLAAAASRLTALGGNLAVSDAPWGGTSVVIRIRDRTGMGQADVRRRG